MLFRSHPVRKHRVTHNHRINIWQSATSPEAMTVIFAGSVVVMPVIVGYTVFAYRVFWGKSTALKY